MSQGAYMKKSYIILLALVIIGLPSCRKSKKVMMEEKHKKVAQNADAFSNVNIPLADNQASDKSASDVESFFDQDINEFVALAEEEGNNKVATQQGDIKGDDYAWMEATEQESFKKVYFDFDQQDIRPDQQACVDYDIEQAKKMVQAEQAVGKAPTVVVEGHACHSAGSAVYNLALSEDRAKKVVDHFKAQGVNVKVVAVGRGKEVPAIINGKPVTGSREEQWPNRRVEIRVINDAATAA